MTISIIIPTLNEEATLPLALDSIRRQERSDVEIIVVDSASKDMTREIASDRGAKVLDYPGRPLGARKFGLSNSKGEMVLLMDADQVLPKGALERAVERIKDRDMLIMEESSYDPRNWLQRSLNNEKCRLHEKAKGTDNIGLHLYPRFFKRDIIVRAYDMIPDELLPKVFIYDDAFLFSKLLSISKDIEILPDAIMHVEEENALEFIRHQLKMGRNAKMIKPDLDKRIFYRTSDRMTRLQEPIMNHYLTMSMLKELSFKFGYHFG